MPTKSEEFKREAILAARAGKPKRKPQRHRRHEGRRGPSLGAETLDRNNKRQAQRRGGAVLEESKTGKPSRKSTRGSIDRTKRTTNLQNKAMMKQHAPSSRAKARRH